MRPQTIYQAFTICRALCQVLFLLVFSFNLHNINLYSYPHFRNKAWRDWEAWRKITQLDSGIASVQKQSLHLYYYTPLRDNSSAKDCLWVKHRNMDLKQNLLIEILIYEQRILCSAKLVYLSMNIQLPGDRATKVTRWPVVYLTTKVRCTKSKGNDFSGNLATLLFFLLLIIK